jgi:acyl-CoA dehydrogenase
MSFAPSDKVLALRARLERFMDEHIYPVEHAYYEFVEDQNNLWQYPPFFEDLKRDARGVR